MADEIVERYTKVAEQFGARVEATPDDAWATQSPCKDWIARDILAHVVGGQAAIVRAATGEELAEDVSVDPKQVWRAANAATKAALAQPGVLEKVVAGPRGEMSLGDLVGQMLTNDVLVHTWDLARTVGGDERLDADAVSRAFDGVRPLDAMLRHPGVFEDKVEPAPDADEQEQLLNFLGRVTRP
jgi:uncharacterized protein (TIGR03086 family)